MRTLMITMLALALTLGACTGQPLFPDNQTNDTNDTNFTAGNFTPLVNDTVNDTDNETQPVDETEYAARISAVEGERIALNTRATDPDGDEVTLTFAEPFGEDGVWQTEVGDAGEYQVAVTASDGQAETTATVLVNVAAANEAPVISGPDVIRVEEGETIDLGVFNIEDPDGDEFVTSYAGYMQSSTRETGFDDAGEHTVTIFAEDTEGNVAEKQVRVVVEDVNRAPTLELGDRSLTVTEGETATIGASASDPDGDEVTLTYEEPFNDEGQWQTEEGDAGEYTISVTASDGEEQVQRTVTVTVEQANRPPTIEIAPTITVQEGETIDLEALANIEDPEGADVDVTYSGWMTSSTYTTNFDDAGEYEVTITATDGQRVTEETVTVVVEDVNRPPVFIRPA